MRLSIILLLIITAAAPSARADEFDALRLRWKEMLSGGADLAVADPDIARSLDALSSAAQSWWDSLDKSPGRTYLWRNLSGLASNSAQITSTYERLKVLALAYATRGTGLESNALLRADLADALDWMNANYYGKSKSAYGNWWDWEIGTPLALNDITVLLYDDLAGAQVANYMDAVERFTPKATRTAANRVWQATVVAVRGAVVKKGSKLASARDALGQVFPDVSSGDGFHADGSFIQHEMHPYVGGYGNSLLGTLVPLMHFLNGSTWQVTDPNRTNVFRWIENSYQPFIYRGAMMDMVRGREISRRASSDHGIGAATMASILRSAPFAPTAEAAACRSMVKHWIQADTARDFVANAPVPMIPLAKEVLNDAGIAPRGELVGHFQFPHMDRVVHLRPGFGLGLSLSSSRIGNYESLNNENVRGWYTGEGMTYLYNGDLNQFGDNFWPTVNPYRLPGTTVDTRTRAGASGQSYRGDFNWVGGASLGRYGVAGMQLDAWSSKLTAKKSWFLFDDELVALGAGITSTDKRAIETIVENRKLNELADNGFAVNGEAKPVALPWSETMTNVLWAHLAGNVAGADIGYYFPQPATLNGLREARTNAWSEINAKSGPTTPYTRNYLTLWFDHGVNPANATYAYVLLPNKTPGAVAEYAASPDIVVLENSPRAQAVHQARLHLTAVNFWNDGAYAVGGITVDKKAAVMVQATGTELEVAVSDPTQASSKRINVELDRAATRLISADPAVTVVALSPRVKLAVNVKKAGGRTFRARFEQATAPAVSPLPLAAASLPAVEPASQNSAAQNPDDEDADSGPPALSTTLPPKLKIQLIGTDTLMFSWPATFPNGRLQAQTTTLDLGLGAEWVDVPGGTNNPVVVPLLKKSPCVFFRLKSP